MNQRGLNTAGASGKSAYETVAEAAAVAVLIDRHFVAPLGPEGTPEARWEALRLSGKASYDVLVRPDDPCWTDILPCTVYGAPFAVPWDRLDTQITHGDWTGNKRRKRKEA